MIYDRAKFECGKWRATVNATTYAEAVPAYIIKARHAGTQKCMGSVASSFCMSVSDVGSLFLSIMVSLLTLYLVPMWSTVNGGLPLLALPFFTGVNVDTDVDSYLPLFWIMCNIKESITFEACVSYPQECCTPHITTGW